MPQYFKEISIRSDRAEEAPAKQRMDGCLRDSKETLPGSIWDWIGRPGCFGDFNGSRSDGGSLFF
jgi:hypothetical protein